MFQFLKASGMPAVLIILAAACCALARAETVPAPRGWTERDAHGVREVARGSTVVEVGPWLDLGGRDARDWLASLADTPPPGAELVANRGVKPEKRTGGFSVTQKVTFDGAAGHAVLYVCPGEPGSVRLIKMQSRGNNLGDLWGAARYMEKVCRDEPRQAGTARVDDGVHDRANDGVDDGPASATVASASSRASVAPRPAEAASRAVLSPQAPPGFVELRGLIVYGIQAGGMFGTTEDFIALFDDGTYSEDLGRVFQDGVAASKAAKPKRWGHWRMRGGKLELKDHNDTAFDEAGGNWAARAGRSDQKLDGCFGSLRSNDGLGSGTRVGQASTWCFLPDGRFSNSSTGFGSSPNATVSARRAQLNGRYRIDGYTAVFRYDDGRELTAAFAFANEDRDHIVLNGRRYMGH